MIQFNGHIIRRWVGEVQPKQPGKKKQQLEMYIWSGQIIATSHEFSPQKVAKDGPYFRETWVGEIL